MPRNGTGTYTLPAGNPVVTGTTISSTVHNNTMSDIADEMTNSVDKDGQTVITGTLDFNGNPIILDADGDSKMEVSTDDRFDVTLGGVLSLSLTSAQALLVDAIGNLTPTDSNFIVGNGTTFVAESGSTARTSLGVDLTTKGTILAGNGTAPTVLGAGTNAYVLTADSAEEAGIKWAPPPTMPTDVQAFTASGTWTKPTGATICMIEVWGGGGGGSNFIASSTAEGGGSGGEYVCVILPASALTGTVAVTIGAGGAGGANGADAAGSTGGTTTFGAYVSALGGNPGTQTNIATIPRSEQTAISSTDFAQRRYFIAPQAGYGGGNSIPAGNTIMGGGGGGASGGTTAGGASVAGGAGGAGNNTLNTAATNGTAPAGGGGGSGNNGGGGSGARGEARITTW